MAQLKHPSESVNREIEILYVLIWRTKRHDQRLKRRKGKGHQISRITFSKGRSSVPRGKIRQVPQDEKRRTKRHVDQRWREGKGKATKSAVSRSSKASLQFPVGRIARYLKTGRYAKRVGWCSGLSCSRSRVPRRGDESKGKDVILKVDEN
ncbi:Histone-fold protein [Raphanus sativus]|nr:Histone-fold protein [Raphanus sativus]